MPPDTQWTGNPNLQLTVPQGNVAFDSTAVKFDATTTPFDGAPTNNLIKIFTPNNTLWTEPNPL